MVIFRMAALFIGIIFFMTIGESLRAVAQGVGQDSIVGVLAKIQDLSNEKKSNEEEMKIELSNKKDSERKLQALQPQIDDLRQKGDTYRKDVITICKRRGGSYDDETGLCKVHCRNDSSCIADMDNLNSRKEKLEAIDAELVEKIAAAKAPANVYDALGRRNHQIDNQISGLRTQLSVLSMAKCQEQAASLARLDEQGQELQRCMDEARSQAELISVDTMTGKPFPENQQPEERKRRKVQDAINEYLHSAPVRGGPAKFKPVVVPPPEPGNR